MIRAILSFRYLDKLAKVKVQCTGEEPSKFILHLVVTELKNDTVELQWLEHLWDHGNLFETGVVRANEG